MDQLASVASTPWVLSLLIAGMMAVMFQWAGRRNKAARPLTAPATDVLSVFYASQKGHSKGFAERLVAHARERGVAAVAIDVAGFDTDRLVEHSRVVFIVATYAGGSAVPGTEYFFSELTEMSRDFRVEKTLLAGISYAIFGCGNSEYPTKDFNAVARRLDRAVRLLGGHRLLARREGDDIDNALSEQFDTWLADFLKVNDSGVGGGAVSAADAQFAAAQGASAKRGGKTKAQMRRLERLQKQGEADMAKAAEEAAARVTAAAASTSTASAGDCEAGDSCCGGEGDERGECCRGGGATGAEQAEAAALDEANPAVVDLGEVNEIEGGFDARGEAQPLPEESDDGSDAGKGGSDGGYGSDGGQVVDMEDMGNMMEKPRAGAAVARKPADGEVAVRGKWSKTAGPETADADRKPMVTPSLHKSLTKQGYKIVGSHSGVKLCRWTKAMLRGRGGCYKHTFYGIVSYQCMEATPSLACANKCVFCWHHHASLHTSLVRPPLLTALGATWQVRLLLASPRQPRWHLLPLAGQRAG